jgi:hypothetical protein
MAGDLAEAHVLPSESMLQRPRRRPDLAGGPDDPAARRVIVEFERNENRLRHRLPQRPVAIGRQGLDARSARRASTV